MYWIILYRNIANVTKSLDPLDQFGECISENNPFAFAILSLVLPLLADSFLLRDFDSIKKISKYG